MSQVRFNVQEFSSLICPDSKHTSQQQKTFRIRIFESKCSHVFRCVFFDLRSESMRSSPSSSDKHRKSSPRIAIFTSWFAWWNSAALCLPLRTPRIRFTQSSCQMCEASCAPHMLLINRPTLSLPYFCGSRRLCNSSVEPPSEWHRLGLVAKSTRR